ncbi:PHP domain-containing protein [Marispirochaeta aestuarii]|uniref:PHP domain-containing protein n=1 Tax=Marispirochaeta aestuarii TaxID=1963862 RepID=UPI002ABD7548|nr:PHP domain-containing protein [Marispirochaeta aestuarii]
MNNGFDDLCHALGDPDLSRRLKAAGEMGELIRAGKIQAEKEPRGEVNNHVHTFYSFSPYSPSLAAFRAWQAGLSAVGIMDHDSVAGAAEMSKAGRALGIATTVGFELRVSMRGTAVEGRKINNPDSPNIAYMAVHGVPSPSLPEAQAFLAPINRRRNQRNRAQTEVLNSLLRDAGIPPLDFDTDVSAISRAAEGGSVTERHILYALADRINGISGKGEGVCSFLDKQLGISLPASLYSRLNDSNNPHYLYDLLGILKSVFLPRFFIQPDEKECLPVKQVVEFARSIGAIPAYAYLGDVGESPTGDKKAEKFEDDYLDDLIPELRHLGFCAVTYMPPRNTRAQLERLSSLCRRAGLMEISGVDINSSRQSFNCPEVMDPAFEHLIEATWALVAHERLASADRRYSLFDERNPWAANPLAARIERYAGYGRGMDPRNPETIINMLETYPAGDN